MEERTAGTDEGRDRKATGKDSEYVRPTQVICDLFPCHERGEYPRCYLDIYKFCPKYHNRKV